MVCPEGPAAAAPPDSEYVAKSRSPCLGGHKDGQLKVRQADDDLVAHLRPSEDTLPFIPATRVSPPLGCEDRANVAGSASGALARICDVKVMEKHQSPTS